MLAMEAINRQSVGKDVSICPKVLVMINMTLEDKFDQAEKPLRPLSDVWLQ